MRRVGREGGGRAVLCHGAVGVEAEALASGWSRPAAATTAAMAAAVASQCIGVVSVCARSGSAEVCTRDVSCGSCGAECRKGSAVGGTSAAGWGWPASCHTSHGSGTVGSPRIPPGVRRALMGNERRRRRVPGSVGELGGGAGTSGCAPKAHPGSDLRAVSVAGRGAALAARARVVIAVGALGGAAAARRGLDSVGQPHGR